MRNSKTTCETICKTPGVVWHIDIHPEGISLVVTLPEGSTEKFTEMTESSAMKLEAELHNAVENVLSDFLDF